MLTFIRSRLVATLVVQLALATSVSPVARAEPAGTKAAAPGFASDGRIDFGTNVLTQAEINRSFRPRLAGYILNNTMVSGLVGDGDELVIEAAVSPAAVTDGTSNTIMFGELVLRRTGFMDYTDDSCMFNGAAAKTVEQGLICGALTHEFNTYLRAQLAGAP